MEVDGDYLGAYRRFFVDFIEQINPDDQLPVKTNGSNIPETELVGVVIDTTLQYLNQKYCPASLQSYIVHLVIEEMKIMSKEKPEDCGWKPQKNIYSPIKLMRAVTGKVNEICQRYLESNSRLALLPPPPANPLPLTTVCSLKNGRRTMEDRHIVLHDLNTIFNIKDDTLASYYAVFDGHAGKDAAVYCAAHLHQYLAESNYYPTDPERALRDAFVTTDAQFVQKSMKDQLSSGTTAVCALIMDKKLYVAWAGDSQAALAKRDVVTQLVNPHRPDRLDERERVERMGGTVMLYGIWRVNGYLGVSRAIGDAQYKPYVTGDPDILCIDLDGTEDFLIVACDGLWDVLDEDTAAGLVYEQIYRNPYDLELVSRNLVDYSKKQGSSDNITVIVIFLTPPCQIIKRTSYTCSLTADVKLNNMEQDNKYLSSTNGQFDVNNDFMKLPKVNKNDYGDESNDKLSSNGKCENGSKNYDVDDDDDFGPETNVDTVDDAGELSSSNHIIRELFPDDELKEPKIDQDITRNENLQVQDNKIKENNEIIGDADNVAESEDSEDEWNYYRADANNDKKEIELSLENDEKLETNTEIENKSIIEFDNNEKLNDNNDIVDDNLSDKFEYKKEAEQDIEEKEKEVINSSTDSSSSNSSSEDECDKENLPPAKVASTSDNNTNVPQESEEGLEQSSSTLEPIQDEQEEQQRKLQQKQQQELEDMEFQLNPNAAEFIPVSPVPMLPNHLRDTPISGSPLKQTPNMDDIRLPSPEEFNKEARHRPGEIDENTNTIISPTNDNEPSKINSPLSKNIDKSKLIFNLDDSEVSSTIAEFGDESAIDLQKTDLFDGSFTSSSNYTTDMDPMMMSFGPGDFNSLSKKVDLNAVHDLSDTDLMSEHDNETNGGDNNGYCEKEDDHPELKDLISPDNDQPKYTEAFPDHQERDMMFNTSSPSLDNDKQDNFNTIDVLTDEIACMNLANSQQSSDIFSNKETVVEEKDKLTDTVEPNVEGKNNELTRDYCESELNNCKNDLMMSEELKNDDEKSGEIDLMSSKNVQEEQMDLMSSDNLMTPEIIDSSKKSVEPEIGEIGTPIEPVVFKSFDDEKSTIESDEICPVREEIIITEVAVEEPEVAVEETKVVVEEPEVVEKILEVVAETPGAVEQILEIVEETPEAVEKIPEVVVTPEIIEKKIEIEETTEETQDLLVNTNEPEEKLTIKLSESLQEFTGLEKEFIPLEKKLPKDDKIEITTKTNDVKPGVVQKLSASTVPKVDAKSKPSKAQPIKSTTLNKVNKTEVKSTSKISPTSPSKGISSAKSAPSGVVGAKKPLTRPKTADGLSKISTTTTTAAKTTTVSKTSTAIKSPATKPPSTTTTTTTTLKPKTMATTSATRPSTLNTRVSEKKVAAVNGDAKIAPAKPKPASRPLVKPPTTTTAASRPATATSTKPRVPLTQTATKPATSKPIDVKIQRPKTAPVTLGIASKTNRISSTTKSPVIDKQIKETANKQISNRVSTVTKTTTRTIGSTTTTTTTSSSTLAARRLTGVKTTTLNSNIDKKTTATTRISAKSATAAAKSSTTNQQKKAVTKVVKKTEIQNGNCEVKDDNIDVVVQEAIANDNNHLIKDSPALPDTIDNQLIITAD